MTHPTTTTQGHSPYRQIYPKTTKIPKLFGNSEPKTKTPSQKYRMNEQEIRSVEIERKQRVLLDIGSIIRSQAMDLSIYPFIHSFLHITTDIVEIIRIRMSILAARF